MNNGESNEQEKVHHPQGLGEQGHLGCLHGHDGSQPRTGTVEERTEARQRLRESSHEGPSREVG